MIALGQFFLRLNNASLCEVVLIGNWRRERAGNNPTARCHSNASSRNPSTIVFAIEQRLPTLVARLIAKLDVSGISHARSGVSGLGLPAVRHATFAKSKTVLPRKPEPERRATMEDKHRPLDLHRANSRFALQTLSPP